MGNIVCNTNSSGWNPSWVWTVWKRAEVAGTRPAVVFAPSGRCLRVIGGWRESRPSRPLVLAGIQVVSCAARPLTLRVASGYRGGVFRTARLTARTAEPATVGSGRVELTRD